MDIHLAFLSYLFLYSSVAKVLITDRLSEQKKQNLLVVTNPQSIEIKGLTTRIVRSEQQEINANNLQIKTCYSHSNIDGCIASSFRLSTIAIDTCQMKVKTFGVAHILYFCAIAYAVSGPKV